MKTLNPARLLAGLRSSPLVRPWVGPDPAFAQTSAAALT